MLDWYPDLPLDPSAKAFGDLYLEGWPDCRYDVQRHARLLRRIDGKAEQLLASKLENCSRKSPCMSFACRRCMRVVRAWLMDRGCYALGSYPASELCKVTFVPGDYIVPGGLCAFDMAGFTRRVRRQIRDVTSGLIVIGGIDFSANEHAYKAWYPHWKPHATMVIGGTDVKTLTGRLRELPRASGAGMHHLVHVQAVTDLPSALSYCMKSSFYRRITFDASRRPIKRSLKAKQLAELLPLLDRAEFDDRVVLCRARIQGDYIVNMVR